jgi:hypothetical protein
MQEILQAFAISTGLKINFSKTQLYPINITEERASSLAGTIGCRVGVMPFTYLGLPMGTTRTSVEDLMPLVCAVERRLSSTALWLTYGGRLTYINSAITPLVTFAMCTLKIPVKIFKFCDRARRHCLWRKYVDGEEKCQSLASWDMVCQPKSKGGLGVINLRLQNQALMIKFLDKFYRKCDIPWVQLIWWAYYDNCVPHARPACGSFWWKDVAKLMDIFRGITECTIRAGDTILLWKDPWCTPLLCESSARLFSYATNVDVSVADFVDEQNLDSHFQFPLSVEAHEELIQLQQQINMDSLDSSTPDGWELVWGASAYKPKDFYKFCFKEIETPGCLQKIWNSKCMMKHKVFAWLMLVDRLNTRNMLRRRNYDIASVYTCLLCDSEQDETRNHLFFGCAFSSSCLELDRTWYTLEH